MSKQLAPIAQVRGREILDSRGNPTVEVDVILADGTLGRAAVPSGASTGIYEAVELRDGDKARYGGKGVTKAVANVNAVLAKVAIGRDPADQVGLDRALIEADGTPNKGKLGANAILGVSLAAAKAAAAAHGLPLYRYIGGANARVLPVPMANIINGGKHADNKIDFQEFMVMPVGAKSFAEGIRMVAEVFHQPQGGAQEGRPQHQRRRRGRLRPQPRQRGRDQVHSRRRRQGRIPAPAATRTSPSRWTAPAPSCSRRAARRAIKFWKSAPDKIFSSQQMIDSSPRGSRSIQIISIEDPLDQDDWAGYAAFTKALGDKVQVVGDDFYVTNTERLAEASPRAAPTAS